MDEYCLFGELLYLTWADSIVLKEVFEFTAVLIVL